MPLSWWSGSSGLLVQRIPGAVAMSMHISHTGVCGQQQEKEQLQEQQQQQQRVQQQCQQQAHSHGQPVAQLAADDDMENMPCPSDPASFPQQPCKLPASDVAAELPLPRANITADGGDWLHSPTIDATTQLPATPPANHSCASIQWNDAASSGSACSSQTVLPACSPSHTASVPAGDRPAAQATAAATATGRLGSSTDDVTQSQQARTLRSCKGSPAVSSTAQVAWPTAAAQATSKLNLWKAIQGHEVFGAFALDVVQLLELHVLRLPEMRLLKDLAAQHLPGAFQRHTAQLCSWADAVDASAAMSEEERLRGQLLAIMTELKRHAKASARQLPAVSSASPHAAVARHASRRSTCAAARPTAAQGAQMRTVAAPAPACTRLQGKSAAVPVRKHATLRLPNKVVATASAAGRASEWSASPQQRRSDRLQETACLAASIREAEHAATAAAIGRLKCMRALRLVGIAAAREHRQPAEQAPAAAAPAGPAAAITRHGCKRTRAAELLGGALTRKRQRVPLDPAWLTAHCYHHSWAEGGLAAVGQHLSLHWRGLPGPAEAAAATGHPAVAAGFIDAMHRAAADLAAVSGGRACSAEPALLSGPAWSVAPACSAGTKGSTSTARSQASPAGAPAAAAAAAAAATAVPSAAATAVPSAAATAVPSEASRQPLSFDLLAQLPVLLVEANQQLPRTCSITLCQRRRGKRFMRPAAYTEQHLVACGFKRVRHSCVIVERGSGTILGLFLTSKEHEELLAATGSHRQLYLLLQELYGGGTPLEGWPVLGKNKQNGGSGTRTLRSDNGTLIMHGTRWRFSCPPDPITGRRLLSCGYYTARSKAAAHRLELDAELHGLIVDAASGACSMEARFSPGMASFRLATAQQQRLPGVLPGVGPEQCAACMIGVSQGYISAPHRDGRSGMMPVAGMSETILFRGASACFALLRAGALLDLGAAGACMVMVPADDFHGTLPPPPGTLNSGTGVVIAAAKQLHTSALAMRHKAVLQQRLAVRRAALQQLGQQPLPADFDWEAVGGSVVLTKPFYRPPGAEEGQ